jgi:hypothetical protein
VHPVDRAALGHHPGAFAGRDQVGDVETEDLFGTGTGVIQHPPQDLLTQANLERQQGDDQRRQRQRGRYGSATCPAGRRLLAASQPRPAGQRDSIDPLRGGADADGTQVSLRRLGVAARAVLSERDDLRSSNARNSDSSLAQ